MTQPVLLLNKRRLSVPILWGGRSHAGGIEVVWEWMCLGCCCAGFVMLHSMGAAAVLACKWSAERAQQGSTHDDQQ